MEGILKSPTKITSELLKFAHLIFSDRHWLFSTVELGDLYKHPYKRFILFFVLITIHAESSRQLGGETS